MGVTDSPRQDAIAANDSAPSEEERAGAVHWGPPRPRHPVLRKARRAVVVAHSSTRTRRVLPMPVASALIEGYVRLAERKQLGVWQQNVTFYGDLLRYTPLAGSEAVVAPRAMREFMEIGEIFWRPWLMTRGEIENAHVLVSAQRHRRGVVTVFPHFGNVYAQFPVMRRYGLDVDVYVVAAPHHYQDNGDGYDARFARQGREYLEMLGEGHSLVRATDSTTPSAFPRVLELLRSGATVSIAFDIVGSLPTPFLGRQLSLTSGAARLAKESDALVVPFVNRRRGAIPVVHFGEPIDPRDFGDAEGLQAQIAWQMEQWALEHPETVWPLFTQPGGSPLIRGPVLGELASASV